VRTVCKFIAGIYVMLCLVALAVIPLNAAGMFGEPDPLSGVFAVILAMPWMHIFTNIVGDAGGNAAAGFIMAGAGMGLNAAILWGLCSWVAKKIAQRTG
jgi:hypothetical protein